MTLACTSNELDVQNELETHTHTHTHTPYKEKAEMVQKILGKSDTSKQTKKENKEKRKKHVWLSERLHIEGRLNEGPRLQRKQEKKKKKETKNEAKQNKGNTREKTSWHLQTKRAEDTSSRHLWLVNKGERTSTSPLALGCPLLGPSRHVPAYHCMPSSLGFLCNDPFRHVMFRPLFCRSASFPSSWGAVVHWLALMPKALRSSRKHPIHSFPWPPTQPAPPTISSNITHFSSLVSSMRATNPANKIRFLRKVASMLSLPVLRSVSR